LDELEDQEAYEYAERDAEFEEEAIDGWTDVKYKVLRERTRGSSPPRQEMSESDIRTRIDALQKRVRKNGTLREDIVVFEKELSELYKQLKSVESAGVPEYTKHWD
jgi:translation initiation factor 1 (eIF-1/SUI1)